MARSVVPLAVIVVSQIRPPSVQLYHMRKEGALFPSSFFHAVCDKVWGGPSEQG